MAVQVASKALVRQWGLHDHESIVVAFRGAEGPGSAYVALSRAITSANDAATSQWVPREALPVFGDDPADIPQGPVSHVAVYTEDDLTTWVDHVAAQLSGEGWTGNLRPATRRHSPLQGRHRRDFVILAGLLTARDFRSDELTKKDRQRLRAMVAAVRKDRALLLEIPNADVSLGRLVTAADM